MAPVTIDLRPPAVWGEWPDQGVTFAVLRGDFTVPADVLARADMTGDDFEIRRAFAVALGHIDEARPYRYERHRGGLRVYWRSIRVVAA
jgi:hypothetical protein